MGCHLDLRRTAVKRSIGTVALLIVVVITAEISRAQPVRGPGIPDDPSQVVQTLNGFKIDLVLRSEPQKHGSWICVHKDDKGRLLLGGQRNQPLTRLTVENGKVVKEEVLKLPISEIMGMLWVGDALYADGAAQLPGDPGFNPDARPNPRGGGGIYGLYRMRDPAGDGSFSSIERLRTWQNGAGEHGAHAILLAPDKQHLFIVCGNAVGQPADVAANSPMRNFGDDRAIMRREGGFMAGEKPPGGSIHRMDLEGKNIERHASGQRNTYDIAINADGEIFGYDSDMEWDWGMPWYRPTRVFHASSGADSGYRGGSGKLPTYCEDTLPPVVDIGLGSPTGVVFGYGAKFPAKYQKALYIMDWSYGRLIAVHLTPMGSSYSATWENFVAPKSLHSMGQKYPLNLTDMVVGDDGAFYFACGGRNTQGYLFRVTYTGGEPTNPADAHDTAGAEARALRRKLESFHAKVDPAALNAAWPHLASDDRYIRYAARLAIEAQPLNEWKSRALAENGSPQASIQALLALARVGGKESAAEVFIALSKIPTASLGEDLQLQKLRTIAVAISRNGRPEPDVAKAIIADLDPLFPSYLPQLNSELSQVLLALDAPQAVAKTVKLAQTARTEDEQIGYLLSLRQIKSGWTPELRRDFFAWFNGDHSNARHPEAVHRWFDEAGARYNNGNEYNLYLGHIRNEALATLSEEEKQDTQLAAILADFKPPAARAGRNTPPPPARRVVKNWKMDDLLPALNDVGKGRNFNRGKMAYEIAQCGICHKFAEANSQGGVGPDLTSVASRFTRRDILESTIEPSKVVSEQFANTIVRTKSDTIDGHIMEDTADKLVVQINPLKPENVTIKKSDVRSRTLSKLSPMPEGLVDVLTKDEILDMLAYIESGGNREHPDFK
jgi:putative heme-binding domain-containing protein